MFSDNILEKIFNKDEVRKVPLQYQSIMIHAIEEAIDEEADKLNATANANEL